MAKLNFLPALRWLHSQEFYVLPTASLLLLIMYLITIGVLFHRLGIIANIYPTPVSRPSSVAPKASEEDVPLIIPH